LNKDDRACFEKVVAELNARKKSPPENVAEKVENDEKSMVDSDNDNEGSPDEITKFLLDLNLPFEVNKFRQQNVTLEALPLLTEEHLREMKVLIGSRVLILNAIKKRFTGNIIL